MKPVEYRILEIKYFYLFKLSAWLYRAMFPEVMPPLGITSFTCTQFDPDYFQHFCEKYLFLDWEKKEGVLYGYDAFGQRVSMMDRSGESDYEYDGLGRISKVTGGSGAATSYAYDGSGQLASITYPDGKQVSYEYDKNDNLTKVTDRTGAATTYVYDAINRITEIHRPNGVSTYNTYNARDQITEMRNICAACEWTVSEYRYTYDDRGFIVDEDVAEALYGYKEEGQDGG